MDDGPSQSKEPIRILIVGDRSDQRDRCRQLLLEARGGETQEIAVFEAATAEAGHALCRVDPPHCILLNCCLPDLTAPQFLARLRDGATKDSYPAVVMLTAPGEEAVAAEAMKSGAQDYLIREHITAETLVASIQTAIKAVKRRLREEDAARQLTQAKAQLQAAGEVQQTMLPQAAPQVSGIEIAGSCLPAEETGGDFFDYLKICDGSFGVVMGDVSGHGLAPAILAADTRAYLRAFAQMEASPGQILRYTNRLMYEDTKGERFVTLFLASIDVKSRVMRFASAGHRVYLVNRFGSVTTIESQQPPLGLAVDFITGIENRLTLQPGDILLLMTDGIPEAACTLDQPRSKATMYGAERALEVVRESRHRSPGEIAESLLTSVQHFTQRQSQDDDMTVVVVKITAD
jgi:serine phosphatase RsbU (regulator of sigma subunit)